MTFFYESGRSTKKIMPIESGAYNEDAPTRMTAGVKVIKKKIIDRVFRPTVIAAVMALLARLCAHFG
jgi:hypothetical protein